MSNEVFVYTMNEGKNRGRWSHYKFPFTIEKFAHLRDSLYLRHGDNVSKVVEGSVTDEGDYDNLLLPGGGNFLLPDGVSVLLFSDQDENFPGIIQFPWLDFGSPGVNKMTIGFDIVGIGDCSLEVGYDQSDLTKFTPSFPIPEDTEPDEIIPFQVNLPSLSIKLTYTGGEAWEWDSFQLWLEDMRPTA